jgi:hypothetical protein
MEAPPKLHLHREQSTITLVLLAPVALRLPDHMVEEFFDDSTNGRLVRVSHDPERQRTPLDYSEARACFESSLGLKIHSASSRGT